MTDKNRRLAAAVRLFPRAAKPGRCGCNDLRSITAQSTPQPARYKKSHRQAISRQKAQNQRLSALTAAYASRFANSAPWAKPAVSAASAVGNRSVTLDDSSSVPAARMFVPGRQTRTVYSQTVGVLGRTCTCTSWVSKTRFFHAYSLIMAVPGFIGERNLARPTLLLQACIASAMALAGYRCVPTAIVSNQAMFAHLVQSRLAFLRISQHMAGQCHTCPTLDNLPAGNHPMFPASAPCQIAS